MTSAPVPLQSPGMSTDQECIRPAGAARPAKAWDRRFAAIGGVLWLALLSGCANEPSRMVLKAVDRAGVQESLSTEFRRCVYHRTAQGLIEVALKTEHPSTEDPTQTITQILYLRQIWNPRLGASFVDSTQVNARVEYAILSPPTGVRYDGSAFISYKIDKYTGELKGRIESGNLSPRYQMGDAIEPFPAARLTGTFRAVESPREVLNARQLIETRFTERLAEPPAAGR